MSTNPLVINYMSWFWSSGDSAAVVGVAKCAWTARSRPKGRCDVWHFWHLLNLPALGQKNILHRPLICCGNWPLRPLHHGVGQLGKEHFQSAEHFVSTRRRICRLLSCHGCTWYLGRFHSNLQLCKWQFYNFGNFNFFIESLYIQKNHKV